MNIPEHLLYSAEHLWVAPTEDGQWYVGISDYAQDLLGDIVYLEAPAVGSSIKRNTACGLVESVKTGSDLLAPADGVVTEVNAAITAAPEKINDAPYDSWIFKMRPDSAEQRADLLDAVKYREFLG